MNEALIEWIRVQQKNGQSFEAIQETALQHGYDIVEVNQALAVCKQRLKRHSMPKAAKIMLLTCLLLGMVAVASILFIHLIAEPSPEEVKQEMITALQNVDNFAFIEETAAQLDITAENQDPFGISLTGTSEGIIHLDTPAVYGNVNLDVSYNGEQFSLMSFLTGEQNTEMYFVDDVIYLQLGEQWMEVPYDDSIDNEELQQYFKTDQHEVLLQQSELEILSRDPLRVRLAPSQDALQTIIEDSLAQQQLPVTALGDLQEIMSSMDVQMEYLLDEEYLPQEQTIVITLTHDFDESDITGNLSLDVEQRVEYFGYNTQEDIVVPQDVKDKVVSQEEAMQAILQNMFAGLEQQF